MVPGAPYPTVPAGAQPVVVCVAVDQTVTTEQSALGTLTYPTKARLVVVDAVDGAVLRDVPAPATSQVAALGTDAVLAHVRARRPRPGVPRRRAHGRRAVVLHDPGDRADRRLRPALGHARDRR